MQISAEYHHRFVFIWQNYRKVYLPRKIMTINHDYRSRIMMMIIIIIVEVSPDNAILQPGWL